MRRPALKRFGQHFLEPAWVDKVIQAIDPKPGEDFIEIGPGRGALTRPLAARAKAVIAYEIDRDLAAALRSDAPPNVTVVEGDVLWTLRSDFRLQTSDLRVVGNLPYNVASPIMFKLAELFASGVPFADATLMLQREVADRLVAQPGTREYGVLSVLVQHVADVAMILKLPAGAFRPPPKVLSALVRLRFHAPDPPVASLETFAALVRSVFTRRRKTLANALLALEQWGRGSAAAGRSPSSVTADRSPSPTISSRSPSPTEALEAAGLDGRRRPETLTVAEFARLADVLTDHPG
jgi:16S rRNA (adenine1518-N6/adenine1519-N6)-dimethyltransferase